MRALIETRPFAGYSDGGEPLGSYATSSTVYALGVAGLLVAARHRGPRAFRLRLGDGLLLGVATHKLSRLVARARVTGVLRAPFVRYERPAPSGEVEETVRGTGWRRAVGELVSCPYCVGPWAALGLSAGLMLRPQETRVVLRLLSAVAASDFLHHAYGLVYARSRAASGAKWESRMRARALRRDLDGDDGRPELR